jgi:predicted PurR-regulated permease PerM
MLTMLGVLTIAALSSFDSTWHALAVPGAYLAINFIQGNVVTPLVMSRRLTLNPVAIFVSLAFWWWMWGIAGALLAVPLLATFKIICDHVETLAAIGAFLGNATDPA